MNTQIVREGESVDLLCKARALNYWASEQGIVLKKNISKKGFEEVKRLRALMQQWVLLSEPNWSNLEQYIAKLNVYLEYGRDGQKLAFVQGTYQIGPMAETLTEQSFIRALAFDFAEILAADKLRLIKQCASDQCILSFLDTSRSKRRRWCSMETCGNRAKAANFYHGHKGSLPKESVKELMI